MGPINSIFRSVIQRERTRMPETHKMGRSSRQSVPLPCACVSRQRTRRNIVESKSCNKSLGARRHPRTTARAHDACTLHQQRVKLHSTVNIYTCYVCIVVLQFFFFASLNCRNLSRRHRLHTFWRRDSVRIKPPPAPTPQQQHHHE